MPQQDLDLQIGFSASKYTCDIFLKKKLVILNVHVCLYSLNDLVEFIKIADVGLAQEVEEGDYDGLVAVMGHLMAVKDRQATTDEMFEPLKQTIELLKTYGQELPEEVHMQLQVGVARFCFSSFSICVGISCGFGVIWYGIF